MWAEGAWAPFVGPEREIKETINSRIRKGKVNLGKEEIGLSQSWKEGPQGIRQIRIFAPPLTSHSRQIVFSHFHYDNGDVGLRRLSFLSRGYKDKSHAELSQVVENASIKCFICLT